MGITHDIQDILHCKKETLHALLIHQKAGNRRVRKAFTAACFQETDHGSDFGSGPSLSHQAKFVFLLQHHALRAVERDHRELDDQQEQLQMMEWERDHGDETWRGPSF